jgi:excisionase family DNA binding protein
MNSEKAEKLASLAEQSSSRIAREAMNFVCQVYSIFKDDFINSQSEKDLSQHSSDTKGNKTVTLPSSNLMIAEEVAELLRVEVKTIYNWAEIGKIPSFKVGSRLRFDREKVLVAIENNPHISLPEIKSTLKETKLRMIK